MLLRYAVWLGLVGNGCGRPHTFTPGDDQAVRGVLFAQRDAWNRGDLAGYMAGYAHDDRLIFTAGGKIRRGWQDTFDKYRAKYGGDASTMGHLEFEVLDVRALGGDGAIVLGRWKLAGPSAGGGIFSVALERSGDTWHVVHDHTSSD